MLQIRIDEQKKKKVLWNGHESTSFACCAADDAGNCYAGASNGLIYVVGGSAVKSTLDFHAGGGFVGAINWSEGKLFSGSKDGKICVTDTSSMTCIQAMAVGTLPRAIDSMNSLLIVGMRSGRIEEFDLETGESKLIHESHNDGEVWGLSSDGTHVFTSGDDNQVKMWDPASRTCVSTAIVNE